MTTESMKGKHNYFVFLFEIRIKLRFLSDIFLLILASVVEIIEMEVGSICRNCPVRTIRFGGTVHQ